LLFKSGMDVAHYIEQIIDEFRSEYNIKPAGVLLGPPEYRMLCQYAKTSSKYSVLQSCFVAGMLTSYLDFPIYVKEISGVELIISPDFAWKMRV